MSIRVHPSTQSQTHFRESGLRNEKIYSVMTVAYMQNGALPNGTVVVPEASKDKWVVQKFGGESFYMCRKAFLSSARNERGQVP
jgi:hypothetical protein